MKFYEAPHEAAHVFPERGCWVERQSEHGLVVWMRCPECSTLAQLDHLVAADGTVQPSVQCVGIGCDWHAMVRLLRWEHGEVRCTGG